MYPYNRNTQLYKSALEMKETRTRDKEEVSESPLAKDKRLIEILALSAKESANMAKRYEMMQEDGTFATSKNVLSAMALDEKKHKKLLEEALFLVLGEPQTIPTGEMEMAQSGKDLLEETLLLELDNGDFFRSLYVAVPIGELRDIFFEIAADKQSHATALTYLFAKYFG